MKKVWPILLLLLLASVAFAASSYRASATPDGKGFDQESIGHNFQLVAQALQAHDQAIQEMIKHIEILENELHPLAKEPNKAPGGFIP